MKILIIHIIVFCDQNISFIFYVKDPMSGCCIGLVFTLPPRDSTLQYKRCQLLWNNFPCICTLFQTKCLTTTSISVRLILRRSKVRVFLWIGDEGRPHKVITKFVFKNCSYILISKKAHPVLVFVLVGSFLFYSIVAIWDKYICRETLWITIKHKKYHQTF